MYPIHKHAGLVFISRTIYISLLIFPFGLIMLSPSGQPKHQLCARADEDDPLWHLRRPPGRVAVSDVLPGSDQPLPHPSPASHQPLDSLCWSVVINYG